MKQSIPRPQVRNIHLVLWLRGFDNNIRTQIGFVVLVLAIIPPLETTIKATAYRFAVLIGRQTAEPESELLNPLPLPDLLQLAVKPNVSRLRVKGCQTHPAEAMYFIPLFPHILSQIDPRLNHPPECLSTGLRLRGMTVQFAQARDFNPRVSATISARAERSARHFVRSLWHSCELWRIPLDFPCFDLVTLIALIGTRVALLAGTRD